MGQLFYRYHKAGIRHKSTEITCPGPQLVILDTAELIKPLQELLARLPTANWELSEVVKFILSAITYERSARTELEYDCMNLVSADLANDPALAADITRALKDVVGFGYELVQQLRLIQAYHNGYLFYVFHSWVGGDMVLTKLHLDTDPEKLMSADEP